MTSYNERLRREIARRDIAVANVATCARASACIVIDKVGQTRSAVRAEIESVNVCIREQIHATGKVVACTIDHAGEAAGRQIETLKSSLLPANLIREHPWGAAIAAMLGGIVLAPLLKSLLNASPVDSVSEKTFPFNVNAGAAQRESKWKPVTDALLANLPGLIAAYIARAKLSSETAGVNGTN